MEKKLQVFQNLQQNSENFIIPQPNSFEFQQIELKNFFFEKCLQIKLINNLISTQKFNFYTLISCSLSSENIGIYPWKNLKNLLNHFGNEKEFYK